MYFLLHWVEALEAQMLQAEVEGDCTRLYPETLSR